MLHVRAVFCRELPDDIFSNCKKAFDCWAFSWWALKGLNLRPLPREETSHPRRINRLAKFILVFHGFSMIIFQAPRRIGGEAGFGRMAAARESPLAEFRLPGRYWGAKPTFADAPEMALMSRLRRQVVQFAALQTWNFIRKGFFCGMAAPTQHLSFGLEDGVP
jgi:hypothetical protein